MQSVQNVMHNWIVIFADLSIHSHFCLVAIWKSIVHLLPTTWLYIPVTYTSYIILPIRAHSPGKCCFNNFGNGMKSFSGISGTSLSRRIFSRHHLFPNGSFMIPWRKPYSKSFTGLTKVLRLHCFRCHASGSPTSKSSQRGGFHDEGLAFPITCHLVLRKRLRNRKALATCVVPSAFLFSTPQLLQMLFIEVDGSWKVIQVQHRYKECWGWLVHACFFVV